MKTRVTTFAAALSLGLTGALTALPASTMAPAAAQAGPRITNGCLASVPEPGTTEQVDICYTLFQPAGASQHAKVPMVIHSHGWGGSRTRTSGPFENFLEAGYGVLSFDQRGFGESGGKAHVQNPDLEGRDVVKLVDFIAGLEWVEKDGRRDPRLGAIGGSYGGGYQFNGAFRFLKTRGKPVFDALAPQITWYDLKESLAPQNVARSEWVSLLTAIGAEALPPEVLVATEYGLATGMWPDGSAPGVANMDEFFERNGPKWHVSKGRKLSIPVLFGQGETDTLFPLRQGLRNWSRALTRQGRARSIFVGYNGGHVLPAVYPTSTDSAGTVPGGVSADPCSRELAGGDFEDLTLRFFAENLKRRNTGLRGYGRMHLATAAGDECVTVRSVAADTAYDVGQVVTPEMAGPALFYEVAQGPLRVAGSPYLTGTMTALGVNNRGFYALAVGTSPLDAKVVQSNTLPVNEPEPVRGERRRITLPSIAVDVPEGQSLFLMASATSDSFVGLSSRTPGAILLENTKVHVPVVR
jgi:ABC-2 type transport system ATP-binding protein